MKKFFSFVSAILVAGTMCAQTITIDGDNTDWAEVPMLTEPGAEGTVLKMVVPQEGLTLAEDAVMAIMVESNHEMITANVPIVFVDADKNNATGQGIWYCAEMGYDYAMNPWMDGASTYAGNSNGTVHELSAKPSAFTSIPFSGGFYAIVGFGPGWDDITIPTDPITNGWKWNESQYHSFNIAPYTFANLNGTHTAAAAYSTHEALLPGETLQLGKDNGNDTALWVSWTVELEEATTYYVTLDITGTTRASADLWLVDVATNKVVAEFAGEDIEAALGKQAYGSWDLSAVPAGKYMLKLKNHVQWSTVALNAITFSKTPTTALENTTIETTSKKVIENGQIYIIRGNKRFNVLGTSVR